MCFETFRKQIEVWNEINEDILEYSKYQDMIESLKLNKEVKGLCSYVNYHIVRVCKEKKDQEIRKILDLLEKKYGRTRLEKLEEWIDNWIEFKVDDHDLNDDLLFSIE